MSRAALLLILAFALPSGALAQAMQEEPGPREGDWEVTLSGNGTSDNDFDNHSFGAAGSLGTFLTDNVLVGVRQSVNFTDVEGSDDIISAATRGFADYVFDFGRFRPYLGASLGGIYGDNTNDTFAAGPEVGIKYYPDNNTFVFAQTEYQFTFDEAAGADEAADDGQFFHQIGVGFNF